VEPKDLWLIFTRYGINIDNYPAIHAYLKQFEDRLTPGIPGGRKPGSYKWYEIQDTIAYWQEFEYPQIVWGNLATSPQFAFAPSGTHLSAPACTIISDNTYVLGILNSRVIHYIISQVAAERRGGFFEFQPMHVTQLPIPAAPADTQAAIGTLAQELSQHAQARYHLHQQVRHRILTDLGTPGQTLTQKLTKWWELDFPNIRREVKQRFGKDVPVRERGEWEVWLQEQREQQQHLTNEIIRQEKALNNLVYTLYDVTTEEVALIEAQTTYPYGD
jgi:hypothetical protein